MKKTYFIFWLLLIFFTQCKKQSKLSKIFDCKTAVEFNNLEIVEDLNKNFSLEIPKHWNINLYQDDVQSSIFTADSTKQLTKTYLIDVSMVHKNIKLDDTFKLQQEQENLSKKLINTHDKTFYFHDKSAVNFHYKGKKETYHYQTNHTFIKLSAQKFIFAKVEVYGDSLINNRFCEAFSLLEKMKFQQ